MTEVVSDELTGVISGKIPAPPRIVIYGLEGVGKSTLAATAERPIFIPTERGTSEIDCDRLPMVATYEDGIERITSLLKKKHSYKTVVFDTLTSFETTIWDKVVAEADPIQGQKPKNIEEVGGGFHKGYQAALPYWHRLLRGLDLLTDKGMTIILLGHTGRETISDPERPSDYHRTIIGLNKHAAGVVSKWADAVLFYSFRISITKSGKGKGDKAIAAPIGPDGGSRFLRTVGGPACMVKNRYELPAEIDIPKPPNFMSVLDMIEAGRNKKGQ